MGKNKQRESGFDYPSYETMSHFQQELPSRKDVAMERLRELSQSDPTISTFLTAWRKGSFQSFEEMMVKLSIQLATEKAEYIKTETKAIQASSSPSTIISLEG